MARTSAVNAASMADILRRRIAAGDYLPGDYLPGEHQLAAEQGATRWTVRQAIKQLVTEGLLTSVDKRGSYVRDRSERPKHRDTRSLTDDEGADRLHAEPDTTRVNAPADLAIQLGIPEHTPVFVRRDQFSTVDGRTVVRQLFVPTGTVAEIPALEENPFRDPTELKIILHDVGHRLSWLEAVAALPATIDDHDRLGVTVGAPVLVTHRTARDRTGRVWVLEETRRAAAGVQLAYELHPTDH